MPYLCAGCAKDHVLRSLAQPTPTAEDCVLCGARTEVVIDLALRHTRQLLRALLRFHFDESQYNGHLGGDSIDAVLSRPNPIIEHSNADGVEQVYFEALYEGYETDALGISLFAGYYDGQQCMPLRALSEAEHPLLSQTRRRLRTENYFHMATSLREQLEPLRAHIEKDVAGGVYTRARIGVEKRAIHRDTGASAYLPYSGDSLLAPPPPLAPAGRINRSGVSFLYAASDAQTAVAEVRPHPGHHVSVGEIRQAASCKLADFSRTWLLEFSGSDRLLESFLFLRTIERDFGTPVVPEERTRYLLGQLLADVLREMGFAGVAYRSSVASGTNFCFFEPGRFEYVEASGTVVEVRALRYDTQAARTIPAGSKEYFKVRAG